MKIIPLIGDDYQILFLNKNAVYDKQTHLARRPLPHNEKLIQEVCLCMEKRSLREIANALIVLTP